MDMSLSEPNSVTVVEGQARIGFEDIPSMNEMDPFHVANISLSIMLVATLRMSFCRKSPGIEGLTPCDMVTMVSATKHLLLDS